MKLLVAGLIIGGFGALLSALQPPTIVGPILLAVGLSCLLFFFLG